MSESESESNFYRVKDMPPDQRPREKAADRGIHTLGDGELLAILLGTGTGKKNALQLGNQLLMKYRNLFNLSREKWQNLCHIKGIGPAKSITLEAAFEISRRINVHTEEERIKIGGPEDLFKHFRHQMAHLQKEVLKVIILNTRNEIIAVEDVSQGLVNATAAHPREIFNKAISHLGTNIILVHNHPSQDPTPSKADRELTKRVFEAGKIVDIPLLDHVIITLNEYYSLKTAGEEIED